MLALFSSFLRTYCTLSFLVLVGSLASCCISTDTLFVLHILFYCDDKRNEINLILTNYSRDPK